MKYRPNNLRYDGSIILTKMPNTHMALKSHPYKFSVTQRARTM